MAKKTRKDERSGSDARPDLVARLKAAIPAWEAEKKRIKAETTVTGKKRQVPGVRVDNETLDILNKIKTLLVTEFGVQRRFDLGLIVKFVAFEKLIGFERELWDLVRARQMN